MELIWETMRLHAIWILVFIVLTTVAMILDLVTGIRKASSRGEFTTSYGLRKTVTKATKYYMLILCCAIFDLLFAPIPLYALPYMSLFAAAYCICCEIKSVFENTREKKETEDIANFLSKIIKSKDDSSALLEMIVKNVMVGEENNDSEKKTLQEWQ